MRYPSDLYKNSNKKKQYNARKLAGLCTKCGKNKPMEKTLVCEVCFDRNNVNNLAIRIEVLTHYGFPYCQCCGEKFTLEFVQLDHIFGGGTKHRRETRRATRQVLRQIKRDGFPPVYQCLCANCNWAKKNDIECPCAIKKKNMLNKLRIVPMIY